MSADFEDKENDADFAGSQSSDITCETPASKALAKFVSNHDLEKCDFVILVEGSALFCHFLPLYLIFEKKLAEQIVKTRPMVLPFIFTPDRKFSGEEIVAVLDVAYRGKNCEEQSLEILSDPKMKDLVDFRKIP